MDALVAWLRAGRQVKIMAKIHHDIVISLSKVREMLREQRLNCIAGLPVPIKSSVTRI
jgi:hypothetical protein